MRSCRRSSEDRSSGEAQPRNDQLFVALASYEEGEAYAVQKAFDCIETFTARFNGMDLAGMDALLHFPHVVLDAGKLVVWDRPGQHGVTFFDELRATGWHRTMYRRKEVVLATPTKAHFLVEYSREDTEGNVRSTHHNLWIVTFEDERWGIKLRSY